MPTTGRWMDQYGWIWQISNAKPDIGYVGLALPMELIWFEDYLALAETLNFSRAAELRHVTQPAFSRRIRALEDWVGVDLFERDSHPVLLTEAGRRFRPVAEELLRHLFQGREEARQADHAAAAKLRFAVTHAL